MSLNATTIACTANGTLGINSTGNSTTCNRPQQPNGQINAPSMPNEARIFLICLYVMIFLLGVTGNAVVCWVIGRKKQMSGSDVFMVSLAFADLLASVFVPLLAIHDFLSNLRWHLGSMMCKILPSISPISLAASSWSLVLIAADRYRGILLFGRCNCYDAEAKGLLCYLSCCHWMDHTNLNSLSTLWSLYTKASRKHLQQ